MNNNQTLFNFFLIDIETVPQVDNYNVLSEEGRKLFAQKISKTMPDEFDIEAAFMDRAGILAEFGKVVCISTGFFYKDKADLTCLKIKSITNHNEYDLLVEFNELLNRMYRHNGAFQFAGHNIREFDIPFLCRRMIINGIQLPNAMNVQGAKPWEIKWLDTMQWWRFGDYKNYTSLNLLAYTLGVPTSKDDIDGSQVQHVYYKENNLQRIATYCEKDVIVVGRIIQRFYGMPIIPDSQIFFSKNEQDAKQTG